MRAYPVDTLGYAEPVGSRDDTSIVKLRFEVRGARLQVHCRANAGEASAAAIKQLTSVRLQ